MKTFHRMSQAAVGMVVACALVLTGCDALFDDQITPYDGPDFVEFGQLCPPNPVVQCYQYNATHDEGVIELQTNLIGPQRSSATEMRFRLIDRIFSAQGAISGLPGFTTINGNASVSVIEDDNVTFVSAAISGATTGDAHPWHVRTGTCDTGGSIVGDAGAYPPLEVGSEGEADATATLNLALDFDGEYHVRILRSADDTGTTIACGDLGAPSIMYQTTAEEGVHYTLPSGRSYTMPANTSFGFLELATIAGSVPSGETVSLALELLGATDGSIMPAGPGPERPRNHHMRYLTVVISG